MKTKQELADKILQNATEEANELLQHAEGVAAYVLAKFPDGIPESFFDSECRSTESALLGAYRPPEVSGRLMLERCRGILDRLRKDALMQQFVEDRG
jgi:hypothetical protein